MKTEIEAAGKTDVGIVRKNNEDSYAFDTKLGVFVLCDGMGGQAAGEVASRLAVEAVLNYFRTAEKTGAFAPVGEPDPALSLAGSAVLSAIRLANTAVIEAATGSRSGMGATIVLVFVSGDTIAVGHAGDSRVYLLRGSELRQLTVDHSLVMEQVRRGYMKPEEADRSPFQNIILRALGRDPDLQPEVQELTAEEGDLLLLACDGLTKVIPRPEMQILLTQEKDLEAAAALLTETAKQNNSDDNITCILARVTKRPWYSVGHSKHTAQGSL
ncbi:MAG: PP2C family protein-serine/threonine phosphatase [Terriglobales bacterium]